MAKNDEDKVWDLLDAWEEALERRREIPIEELCRDCPHLIDDMKERIAALRSMQWLSNASAPIQRTEAAEDDSSGLPDYARLTRAATSYGELEPLWDLSHQEFLLRLRQSGLMTAKEIADYERQIDQDARIVAGPFAELLVEQGKLTLYQAKALASQELPAFVFGEYVVIDELGAGGMGRVFKAVQRRLNKVFALKVLHSATVASADAVKRFHQEIKAAAQLDHPHIVGAVYAGQHAGMHYFVMEHVEGESMADLCRRRSSLPIRETLRYIAQAAEGLEQAHRQGVIHRDIKPGNLMIDKRDRVRILDFGLARTAGFGSQSPEHLTETGAAVGSAPYMAPEQALDIKNADHRVDIYSLGCTLYTLATGKHPYQGDTLVEMILAHREQPIPNLASQLAVAPDGLQAVFEKMVAKKPADRYDSMTQLLAALNELNTPLPETVVQTRRTATFPVAAPPRSRRRAAIFGGALALIALAASLAWIFWPRCSIAMPDGGDPQVRAAKWVLAHGGAVGVESNSGSVLRIEREDHLPTTDFRLREIDLSRADLLTGRCFPPLTALPLNDVQTLDLSFLRSPGPALASLSNFRSLRTLDLTGANVTDSSLRRLGDMASLRELYLSGTRLTNQGMERLRSFSQLRKLAVEHTAVSERGLAAIVVLTDLQSLAVSHEGCDAASLEQIGRVNSLRELSLSFGTLTPDIAAPLTKMDNLERLALSHFEIAPQTLSQLAKSSSLRRLVLSRCDYDEADVEELTSKSTSLQLETLD